MRCTAHVCAAQVESLLKRAVQYCPQVRPRLGSACLLCVGRTACLPAASSTALAAWLLCRAAALQAEVLWLMAAKHRWRVAKDVAGAWHAPCTLWGCMAPGLCLQGGLLCLCLLHPTATTCAWLES